MGITTVLDNSAGELPWGVDGWGGSMVTCMYGRDARVGGEGLAFRCRTPIPSSNKQEGRVWGGSEEGVEWESEP